MLGNDEWGDCVPAGDAHLAEAATFFGQGSETVITTDQALAAYTAIAGFNPDAGPPGNNPTDTGCTLQAGLAYLVKTGIGGVEFAAYGELDVKNTNQWQQALATFGPLMLGVGVGSAEEQQFSAGQPWSLTPGAAANPEDHCVILTGYEPGMYYAWTWGAIQGIEAAWFDVNAYEIWAPISRLWVSANTGRDPEGVDLAVLGQLYQQITGQPDPFTTGG